jgi:hypothetical protein
MRYRLSTHEFCYTLDEFKKLSHAAICRRYNLGDSWVDEQADEQAEKEVSRATQTV